MSTKLILTITISVTSQDPFGSKRYIDPDTVTASDVVSVECPIGIDPKSLDVSKVIQGTIPGIIDEHMTLRHDELQRLKELEQPSLLTAR